MHLQICASPGATKNPIHPGKKSHRNVSAEARNRWEDYTVWKYCIVEDWRVHMWESSELGKLKEYTNGYVVKTRVEGPHTSRIAGSRVTEGYWQIVSDPVLHPSSSSSSPSIPPILILAGPCTTVAMINTNNNATFAGGSSGGWLTMIDSYLCQTNYLYAQTSSGKP